MRSAGLAGGWEGEGGEGWQEYQLCSSPRGVLDVWKQRGGESRCMGIQKSLHMHQSYAARGQMMLNGDGEEWM